MARMQRKNRPAPRFNDGAFIPSVPVPDPRRIEDYKWYHIPGSIAAVVRNPLETFTLSQFKDPVTQYRLLMGAFTVPNDPKLIHYCFVENRQNYRFSAIRQRILRSLLGDGLLTAEGEKWASARRTMAPMFTPRNISGFAAMMRDTTLHEMPALFDREAPFEIAPALSTLTYLVLSDTLFSGDIDEDQTEILRDVATALTYMGRPEPMDLLGAPNWLPRLTRWPGMKAVKRLRRNITQVLAQRRVQKQAGQPLPDDFLTRLLSIGDDGGQTFNAVEIEDHLLAFIGAGHETTARALSWLFYLLSQDTQVRDRLYTEVDTLDIESVPPESWREHLPFTTACFEETMRLFPPAPFIVREAIDNDEFGNVKIAKNSILFLNTWQLHRHETLWEAPNTFWPERFLPKNRKHISRFQYLPFGVGKRVCIGQGFAMQEALILIALLARHYRFEYTGKTPPWPKMRITVQPENGMPMRVTRR